MSTLAGQKTHEQIVSAFLGRRRKKIGHFSTDGDELRVHGNVVAKLDPDSLTIMDAGWQTLLTKSVLNEVIDQADRHGFKFPGYIAQKRHKWYIGDEPRKGSYTLRTRELQTAGSLTRDEADFVDFLERTLGPDLRESGFEATADDVERAAKYIRDPLYWDKTAGTATEFVEFLEGTFIPDLHESGTHETAETFEQAVEMIQRRSDRV